MGGKVARLCWGWQEALVGASIVTSCFSLTLPNDADPEIAITCEPLQPLEGGNITMTPGGKPNFGFCLWNRGQLVSTNWILMYFPPPYPSQEEGPGFSRRETGGPNCSLHIKNLLLSDSGLYMVRKFGTHFAAELGQIRIKVLDHRGFDNNTLAEITVGSLAGAVLIGFLLYYCFHRYGQRVSQRVSSLFPSVCAKNRPTVS